MVSVRGNRLGKMPWRQDVPHDFSLHCGVTATVPRQAAWYRFCTFSGDTMKRLATAIAVAGLIGTPAFAADMGVPSGPPPAPVYNWTGWYVGVNAGASMGKVKTDYSVDTVHVKSVLPGLNGPFQLDGFSGSNTEYPDGF